MITIKDIEYKNIQSGREGKLIDCFKPDAIKKYQSEIDRVLHKANNIDFSKIDNCFKVKGKFEVKVFAKKFPPRKDMDFAWRVYPSSMKFYVWVNSWELNEIYKID